MWISINIIAINDIMAEVFLGTELKLNINIEPMGEFTMEDYDWSADVYCSAKKIMTIPKSEAIKVDENNYVILVDTSEIGSGEVKCKITAYIPDNDFNDGLRTEVALVMTNINIIKTL